MSTSLSMRQIGERMDPVYPVQRLRGAAETPEVSWYKGDNTTKLKRALRTYGGDVGLYHQRKKGLSQVHRERFTDHPTISLRRFVDRHQQAKTVRMLVYNTYLIKTPLGIDSPPDRLYRSQNLARRLKDSDYDIIALCEVFEEEDIERFRRHLSNMDSRTGPSGVDRVNDPVGLTISSGLVTFAGLSGFGNVERYKFNATGGLPESKANKGVLYTEIDVGLSGCINIFSTHLHATDESIRKTQIVELATFIAWHQKQKPENVTIVVGDFNVDGRKDQYEYLLNKLGEPWHGTYIHPGGDLRRFDNLKVDLNLEDIWLARGGPSGSTHTIRNMEVVCKLDNPSEPGAPYYCNDEYVYQGDPTSPTDNIPGYRLDYVFVEKPSPEHKINVDISRIRRHPFWRAPGDPQTADPTIFGSDSGRSHFQPHFLSDHIGLDLTLYVSPL